MGAIAGNPGAIIGIILGSIFVLYGLSSLATSDYVAVERSTSDGPEDTSGGTRRRKKRKGTHRR